MELTERRVPKSRSASFAREAQRRFAHFIQSEDYPCLGARAAVNSHECDVRCYRTLGRNVSALARDLSDFISSPKRQGMKFATFAAIFRGPARLTEVEFEQRLWTVLRDLNKIDSAPWDSSVTANPADANFAFSFGGVAFYIVGMHPQSSRASRRFDFPALVFNAHEQFRRLRAEGKWERMRASIRQRDFALQGTHNPMLTDFGERSEARQYSGRAVPDDWRAPLKRCPFGH
jgi:FPC/CPF motif-containing protein YcgG